MPRFQHGGPLAWSVREGARGEGGRDGWRERGREGREGGREGREGEERGGEREEGG